MRAYMCENDNFIYFQLPEDCGDIIVTKAVDMWSKTS